MQEESGNAEAMIQLVCFKLANEEYAVKITDIREVIRTRRITKVPQTPVFALGIINLRGSIIPVYDLRSWFKLSMKEFDHVTKIIIADVGGEEFSMVVDEVIENVILESSQIDAAPKGGLWINRECVLGLGELEGRMITILNYKKVHADIKKEMLAYVIHHGS